jgi:molybdopterin-containing oxidoreductase family membrane subunit
MKTIKPDSREIHTLQEPYLKPIFSTTKPFYASVILALLVLAVGAYAFYLQFIVGHIVTGLGTISAGGVNSGIYSAGGVTYGLYIAFAIYFIGISYAGISTSAAVRLLGLEKYRPVTRMAELLTVIALILGATSILVDLGNPLNVLYLVFYGRLTSPFFYTFSVVIAGYLWASLNYVFLSGRRDAAIVAQSAPRLKWLYKLWSWRYEFTSDVSERHERALWWLSLGVLPMLVMAHSFLGYVFGLQGGRPGWYSAIQAPAFVVIAGASGVSALMIIAAILRGFFNFKEQLSLDIFRGLSNFVMVSVAAYLYFMASEAYTGLYAATEHEQAVYQAMYFGTYAAIAWFAVGSFLLAFFMMFAMFLRKKYEMTWMITAAVLVNLASIAVRFLIVVPSQTHGMLLAFYPVGVYCPSWVEWSVIAGLFALGYLLYTAFLKVFPIVELPTQ